MPCLPSSSTIPQKPHPTFVDLQHHAKPVLQRRYCFFSTDIPDIGDNISAVQMSHLPEFEDPTSLQN